ncbi:hypothetical protein FAES_1170 [Fibrella aestuarina BUZ 2]|uniref:Uncharacterized protein n=1 Tax=Fibrella aestuarina BUZ 2 TaxID=1166018 RepID=I0K4X7_9BACT|nr:hypothetical protein [Fibrella aestuarina]CCG99180.1 hypothetical protein FAES_1170 [Fibrella aestuarina BUZ 2]
MTTFSNALLSGLAGAVALNALHETVRQFTPEAPRVDKLGKRGIIKLTKAANVPTPTGKSLYAAALAGDLTSNALYYSLIGTVSPKAALPMGAVLGTLAGAGAVTLAEPLGLGDEPVRHTATTAALTITWYAVGGLVTAAVFSWLSRN